MINRNKELEKKLMDLLDESSKTANNEGLCYNCKCSDCII